MAGYDNPEMVGVLFNDILKINVTANLPAGQTSSVLSVWVDYK